MKDLLKDFKLKKINDLKEAQAKKNNSESDKLEWKKAVSIVKEIDAAIKSGVKNLDELAAAASLLMGQANEGIPIVLIRGFTAFNQLRDTETGIKPLLRPKEFDVFRK